MPLRQGPEPKSRLAARLSAEQRIALSQRMAKTVLHALDGCVEVSRMILLSPHEPALDYAGEWHRDKGRGLNEELTALRADLAGAAMLVAHGDLPLVGSDDISALIAGAAQHGHGLAADRHGAGTNGVAIAAGQPFDFSFGEGSLARHLASARTALVLHRPGLAIDVDTPDDLDAAIAAGFVLPL